MEQPLLIPVELEDFDFTQDLSDFAQLGFEPEPASVDFVRQFAREFRPL